MPRLPAICLNHNCGYVFPTSVEAEGSENLFTECTAGPCPKCGSIGRIPDGEYSAIANRLSAKLIHITDLQLLLSIQNAVQSAINENSKDIISSKLNKEIPDWKDIWNLIPENKTDAIAVLQLILAFLATVISIYSLTSAQPSQTTIINQSFEIFYQHEHQRGNHNENKLFRTRLLAESIRKSLT